MHSEGSSWNAQKIRRTGRPLVDWLRLGTLGDPEVTVGVLRDGSWVVETADGLAELGDDRALTFAFPILNSSIPDFHQRLAQFQSSAENAIWQEFPLGRLIVHAISGGGYWAEQSLPWLSKIELDDCANKSIIDGLTAIENNKEFNQTLRHKARQHRRRMENSSS